MEKEKKEVALINEEMIQEKIYLVRGQKVMLDVDLAEIYGYETKTFNQQVKNNIEKFDDDFMFQLTKEEWENLRSKNLTSSWGGSRYIPHVFTEQGIYMLMTVLKGDLAVKQSKALIRTFKRMKDYILENQNLIGDREYLQLSLQVSESFIETKKLRSDLYDVEDQMADVIEQLSNMVSRSELSDIMSKFGYATLKRGYLLLDGHPFKADLAYDEIYTHAKKTIYIVDNYIGIKTLELLINVSPDVEIIIFSDNLLKGLRENTYADFRKEYPSLKISICASGGIFHDRYIILDYDTDDERIFHCGASSKNAGERVTTILEDPDTGKYHGLVDKLLENERLELS